MDPKIKESLMIVRNLRKEGKNDEAVIEMAAFLCYNAEALICLLVSKIEQKEYYYEKINYLIHKCEEVERYEFCGFLKLIMECIDEVEEKFNKLNENAREEDKND